MNIGISKQDIKALIASAQKKFQERDEKSTVVTVYTDCHDSKGIVFRLGLRLANNIYGQWSVWLIVGFNRTPDVYKGFSHCGIRVFRSCVTMGSYLRAAVIEADIMKGVKSLTKLYYASQWPDIDNPVVSDHPDDNGVWELWYEDSTPFENPWSFQRFSSLKAALSSIFKGYRLYRQNGKTPDMYGHFFIYFLSPTDIENRKKYIHDYNAAVRADAIIGDKQKAEMLHVVEDIADRACGCLESIVDSDNIDSEWRDERLDAKLTICRRDLSDYDFDARMSIDKTIYYGKLTFRMPRFVDALKSKEADDLAGISEWLKEDKSGWIDDIVAQYVDEMDNWMIKAAKEYK